MVSVAQIGTLADDYVYAAFSPDGSTLYVVPNVGPAGSDDIHEFAYPALVDQGAIVNNILGPVAADDAGELYWIDTSGAVATLVTDPSSPTVLHTWTETLERIALCWSPYDGNLYVLLETSSPATEKGLWRVTTGGTATLVEPIAGTLFDSAGRGIVPTLDGGIWWQGSNVVRYDIPTDAFATLSGVTTSLSDSWIPQPDHTVIGYAFVGGVGAGRRVTYSGGSLSASLEPAADVLSTGQRGVAYVADLSVVAVERHVTGEVWEIRSGRKWWVGVTGWG